VRALWRHRGGFFRRVLPSVAGLFLVLALGSAGSLGGRELPSALRTASELYRQGRLDDACGFAEAYHRAFPKDIEGLVILGRIEFERRNLPAAKRCFRQASVLNRNHPLVTQYRQTIEEYEYRRGIIQEDYLPLPVPDKGETAERFRRGWFGPHFTKMFGKVATPPRTIPDSLGVATYSIGEIAGGSIDFLAVKALNDGWYLKAYLLYRELVRDHPNDMAFRLGLAEAAIGIKRLAEARNHLTQILRADPENPRAHELMVQAKKDSPTVAP
jgi:tetratricopeptide (TPR) repeat protein